MKHLFGVLCFLITSALFAGDTIVIYIKTGDSDIDPDSYTDVTKMCSVLTAQNAANGHSYTPKVFETFAAARDFVTHDLPAGTTAVAGVAHGVFVSGHYAGTVKEVGGAQLESDVVDIFMRDAFAHCSEGNKIDIDQVAAIVARANPGDHYSPPLVNNGGVSGANGSGHYEYFACDVWIWYEQENGHLAAYLDTVTIAVWVPDPVDESQYVA